MTQAAKDAAKFLKSTLRLPAATFPPRPRPADIAKYLPKCTDDLYAWQRRERPASNTFVLHDGPPYANGDLHVGHALNKIIKDIICRSRLLEGKRVDYVPGWDCHGLPIELKALEQNGWDRGQGVDPGAIRKAARKFASKTVEKQMAGFRSWAVMGDWANHWTTMQKDFELRQLSVFQAMAQHGLIYRRHKPVFWSPSSGTALAEAELEYQDDHVSNAALVKFPLDSFAPFADGPVHALIWTTTPWTLPANQAIAVNSSLQYCLVRSDHHGLLIVAQPRLQYLAETIGEPLEVVLDSIPTDKLLRSTYSGLPQFGKGAAKRPFIHADFVSAESGTGLVHCAPGHGMEDYEALQPLIKASSISVKAPVDSLGRFDSTASPPDPGLLEGQYVFEEGNKTVMEMLQTKDLLVHQHLYRHKYPVDWRTKEPVIIRATAQWFADISKIRNDTLQALDTVKFLPKTGNGRLRSFVENRTEWCISRQRAWGVPIPAIHHKRTGEAVLTPESISHIIGVIRERGIDAWWSDEPDDPGWIVPGLPSPSSEYCRGADTMDVWFDSGTSWTSILSSNSSTSAPSQAQSAPLADIYVEGTDQHRGWFQSSLLTNVAYQKSLPPTAVSDSPASFQVHAPFRTLATHGFTLDAQGKKMSKSLGNVIAPSEIIAGLGPPAPTKTKSKREVHPLGPDALRLWVASSEWTKDVAISEKVVISVHHALDKYRLTMKMLLGMLADSDPQMLVPYEKMSRLDQIAMLHLHDVCSSVRKAYSDLEFHKAASAIYRWVANELSSFYFEAIKDVIYCDGPSSQRRLSAQTALHHILYQLQNMLAPMTPLLVEESWEHSPETYKATLEHPLRRIWTSVPEEWYDPTLKAVFPSLMAINSSVKAAQEAARTRKFMGQSLASDVTIHIQSGIDLPSIPIDTLTEVLVVSAVEIIKHDNIEEVISAHSTSDSSRVWTLSSEIKTSEGQTIGLAVVQSPRGDKCARCWRYVVEPRGSKNNSGSKDEEQLSLCGRCTNAVEEFRVNWATGHRIPLHQSGHQMPLFM
ncbi:isoleucine-tRNA ligase [Rhinocladiella mackenziei CBS 650.93]|uniref:Isoleucine--tRNA ligase, mitochondrial n=1 Tax=Rhinocladiella mackenziei CBS 650.93 TaxID=1442369 RepID=A0A0D2IAH9_9EURO|nr:isoleucine-tRNA ligase [Rhinocladiella mackenziei CBS 650.93]KIX00251.1 isoleucine-tRNA ligase [Rhinocladiella mackenziei CBS 650.93]